MSLYDDKEICGGCIFAVFYDCGNCLKRCIVRAEDKRDRKKGTCERRAKIERKR